MLFSGAMTALVTPFKNNAVDEEAYRAFIERQITEGIHGLVPCGTTGESATLSHEEHERVIEICIDQAKGRVPVLAGAGSNNTSEAVRLARFAKKAGADGALLITPYYNKPTQEGLYLHFKAIAETVDLPLVLYNVPGRTGCNMLPPVLSRLARDFSNIVGVKEATGDMVQGSEILESCPAGFSVLSGDDLTALHNVPGRTGCNMLPPALSRLARDFSNLVGVKEATGDMVQGSEILESCPAGFSVLSGDDLTALPLMALGGKGVISVTSNLVPGRVAAMCNAFAEGDPAGAARLHHDLFPLHQAMFMESNPIPAKTALALMGRMESEMRLPLCPMSESGKTRLIEVLRRQGLL